VLHFVTHHLLCKTEVTFLRYFLALDFVDKHSVQLIGLQMRVLEVTTIIQRDERKVSFFLISLNII